MSTPGRLDGQQVAQICNTLIAAFDRSDLRALTRIELDQELDTIAGGENMQDLALSLVDWAEDTGRVPDLIAAMQRRNPTNPEVQALVDASAAWFRRGTTTRPGPAAAPSAAPRARTSFRRVPIAALVVLALFGCAAVFAVARFGDLFIPPSSSRPAGSATGKPDVAASARTETASVATAAGATSPAPSTQPIATAAPGAGQTPAALTFTTPDQDWNLGTRVYRILSASGAQLNPTQTQVELQIRMTNNGLANDVLTAEDIRLLDGGTTYENVEDMRQCFGLVARAAAKDDCHVRFIVNAVPPTMTLRLQTPEAQTDIPLAIGTTSGPAAPTPAPPAGMITVQAPVGTWPVDAFAYQVLTTDMVAYDATRTTITFHIAMANNNIASQPLWGESTRLLVDGVPRAPEDDWGKTCLTHVSAGQSSDRCTVKFVVPNTAADLELRFQNLDSGTAVTVPLTTSHTAP